MLLRLVRFSSRALLHNLRGKKGRPKIAAWMEFMTHEFEAKRIVYEEARDALQNGGI